MAYSTDWESQFNTCQSALSASSRLYQDLLQRHGDLKDASDDLAKERTHHQERAKIAEAKLAKIEEFATSLADDYGPWARYVRGVLRRLLTGGYGILSYAEMLSDSASTSSGPNQDDR